MSVLCPQVLTQGWAQGRSQTCTCGKDEQMSFQLEFKGSFRGSFKRANEGISFLPPKGTQETSENFTSRLEVESNGNKLSAIHSGFKISFGAHTIPARDNRWCGAEVRGQHTALRANRDRVPLTVMDGSNLQLLIVPKEFSETPTPNHTHGERKDRSQGQSFSQQNWSHLRNGEGRSPHLSLPYKRLNDVFSSPS